MDAVEDLLKTLEQTGRNLDRPDLEPDPGRTDWASHEEDLSALRSSIDEALLPKLDEAIEQLGDDPGIPRLRDEVAYLTAETGAVLHAAGKRDHAARYVEEALKVGPTDPVRDEIESARRDMDGYVRLVHGRWHHRGGDFDTGDRILREAKRGVAEPGLKKIYDRVLDGPRPLKGGAPALFRFNGFGVGLYGHRDPRPDGTYVSTHCISALFIPVWPLSAYRVRDAGHNAYEFFAREPLSGFAKGYRWFAAAAVLLAILGWGISGYLNSPSRLAANALEDAQAVEASGDREAAIEAYQSVIDGHAYASASVAAEASTGLMRLLVAGVETPMTAPRVDEATRIVRRYQELPSPAQGGPAASLLASALDEWATQIGTGDEAARRAGLRLLDLGVSVAQGPDHDRLAERAAAGHLELADSLRDHWPLEALSHYVAAASPAGWERAGSLVLELPPSLHEDAGASLTAVSEASATSPEVHARIAEVRATLEGWAENPDRTQALETGDAEVLATLHEAQPEDQEVTAALADAKRAAGDVEGAQALLRTIGEPGLMSSRAQVALAGCYLAQDQLEEADALLSRQVDARLPAFAEASQAYDAASSGRIDALLARGQYDRELNQRLAGVSDEEGRRIVGEWMRGQLDADPELRRLREAMVAESSVVPTALMLGTVKLRRAHAATGEQRQALLNEAERLFLAIRNQAEGVPQFHLNLGQVYHRLGRTEEGENELRSLLAQGDLSVNLQVGHAYRELGMEARAREVAHDVFAQTENAVDLPIPTPGGMTNDQIHSEAAMLLSLLATRLEDEERWLAEANQEDEAVQIRLMQIRARRAYERRDLGEAERLFTQVAERYLAQGPSNAAAMNNAAIAFEEQYLCRGDDATLDRALSTLERALTLQPDNALLVGNLAELARYRGDVDVLSGFVDTSVLRLDPESASSLVSLLLAGPRGGEVRAALMSNAQHRRARELVQQQQVLAPQRTRGWQAELDHIGRVPDVEALAQLDQRLSRVQGLDTSAYTESRERERTAEDEQRLNEQLDSAVDDAQALVTSARRARSAPTLAAALQLSATYLMSRAWDRRSIEDADAAVEAAREAQRTWDGFSPKILASALMTKAFLEIMPGTALERAHESERRDYSPVFLALKSTREDPSLMSALNGHALMDEAAQLRVGTPREYLGVTDVVIARLADHAGLREATAHVTSDRRAALALSIAERLTPGNPELPLWREQLD